jgi:adenylate cyclase
MEVPAASIGGIGMSVGRALRRTYRSVSRRLGRAWKAVQGAAARHIKRAIYMPAGAAIFLLAFFLIDLPQGPDHWSADLITKYFSKRLEQQHGKIALVEITNRTLDQYPYVSPIDRKLLADLIRTIDAAQPKAIGLDFIFDRHTEKSKDAELVDAIQSARAPVVLGALDGEALSEPERTSQSEFLDAMHRPVGHLYLGEHRGNPLTINEHVIRLIADPSDTPLGKRRSFAEVLAGPGHDDGDEAERQISWLLRPCEGSRGWFSWQGWYCWFGQPESGIETFLTLPADQVLIHDRIGLPLQEILRDRIVLIGGNFADRDQHLTPLSVLGEDRFSGLFIHAQILAQLLANDRIYDLPKWPLYSALLVLFLFGIWVGTRDRTDHYELAIEAAAVIVLVVVSVVTFRYIHFSFPVVSVLVTWLAGIAGGHFSKLALE